MSTADRYRLLRSGYYRRLELGALIALGLHTLVFTLAPPYVPRPFRLPAQPPLRLVDTGGLAGGAEAAPDTPPPAGIVRSVPMPPLAAIRSEQLEAAPAAQARGAPGAEAGTTIGSGARPGDDAPPVFYAYDMAPRVVRKVEPEYPMMARVAGIEGTIVINVNLDESGRIMRAWVAQSTGSDVLVTAALDAIYQFEFLPGKQGDHPVKCTVAVPFRFRLERTQ